MTCILNALLQCAVMWYSLNALIKGENTISPQLALFAEFFGLILVILATLMNNSTARMIARHNGREAAEKAQTKEDSSNDND